MSLAFAIFHLQSATIASPKTSGFVFIVYLLRFICDTSDKDDSGSFSFVTGYRERENGELVVYLSREFHCDTPDSFCSNAHTKVFFLG